MCYGAYWKVSAQDNVDGSPPRSESLAHMPREPAAPAEPEPTFKEHGLDLATSPFAGWRVTSKTVISLPGHWPVKQSFRCLETAQYQNRDPAEKKCEVKRKKNRSVKW